MWESTLQNLAMSMQPSHLHRSYVLPTQSVVAAVKIRASSAGTPVFVLAPTRGQAEFLRRMLLTNSLLAYSRFRRRTECLLVHPNIPQRLLKQPLVQHRLPAKTWLSAGTFSCTSLFWGKDSPFHQTKSFKRRRQGSSCQKIIVNFA